MEAKGNTRGKRAKITIIYAPEILPKSCQSVALFFKPRIRLSTI
jgi:hypothetical protein